MNLTYPARHAKAAPAPESPLLSWEVHWIDAQGQHRTFTTRAANFETAAWAASNGIGTLDRVSEGRIYSLTLEAGQEL